MMGIYPDAPAIPQYTITSPYFDEVTISLGSDYYSGNIFVIETVRSTPKDIYIDKMELNGKKLDEYFISHDDIAKGGRLKIWLK